MRTLPAIPTCATMIECLPMTHVVSDLHQVVDLDPFLDPGASKACPIDRRVGADLHIVIDLDDADLRHFLVSARGHFKTEAVRADHGATVNNDAFADPGAFTNRDVGIDQGPRADRRLVPNIAVRTDPRARANLHPWFDDRVSPDETSLPNDTPGATTALE